MLCFFLGSSRQSLKVREVKCIPGDAALMCPVLFKGSRSPLSLALALCSLLYIVFYLVRRYLGFVSRVVLCLRVRHCMSVFLFYAGVSLFIINGLYVYMVVCVVYVYNLTLWQREKQKDSLGRGCSCFYTAGTYHMWWLNTTYAVYWKFGMMHMTSCPGQQPLVESLRQLLCQPIAAILQQLEGWNQGLVGLDYRCTGDSGAQRSGSLFTITYSYINI